MQFVVPHTYGVHERNIPGAHVPAASQRPATRSAPALHESMPHTVLTAYLRQAPMPLHIPSSPQVAAVSSAQCPCRSWPSGTLRQVPSLPATAHDRHVPVQTVPQHLPCAQNVELHSSLLPQVAPIGFLPQLPATQLLGATQSASDVHVVRQVLPSGAHWNGVQGSVVAPEQPPALSHVPVVVRMNPRQASAAHTTPALPLKRAHAPVPSHTPVVPQVVAASVGQRSPGSVPWNAGRHVPSVPGFTQVKQARLQPSLQQTPSTHWPEPHSVELAQESPSPFAGLSGVATSGVAVSGVAVSGVAAMSAAMSWPASCFTASAPPSQAPAAATNASITAQPVRAAHPSRPPCPLPFARPVPGAPARTSGSQATAIGEPFARGNCYYMRAWREGFSSPPKQVSKGSSLSYALSRAEIHSSTPFPARCAGIRLGEQ